MILAEIYISLILLSESSLCYQDGKVDDRLPKIQILHLIETRALTLNPQLVLMYSTSSDQQDENYLALPDKIKQFIDTAFDIVTGFNSDTNFTNSAAEEPPRKRRKVVPDPGGFVVDDAESGGFIADDFDAGGFLPPSPSLPPSSRDSPQPQIHDRIPLSQIPTALVHLNLPPDDEDVLVVFKNAASGWSSSHTERDQVSIESTVSRKDFRAVCAVLLDTGDEAPSPSTNVSAEPPGGGFLLDEDVDMIEGGGFIVPLGSRNHGDSGDDSGDAYQYPDSDPETDAGDDSVDEYMDSPRKNAPQHTRSTRSSRKRHRMALSDDDEVAEPDKPKALSSRQKKDARLAFALFFPEVEDSNLDTQKIMIKDIIRVANVLKEKIKAEEVRTLTFNRNTRISLFDGTPNR